MRSVLLRVMLTKKSDDRVGVEMTDVAWVRLREETL